MRALTPVLTHGIGIPVAALVVVVLTSLSFGDALFLVAALAGAWEFACRQIRRIVREEIARGRRVVAMQRPTIRVPK